MIALQNAPGRAAARPLVLLFGATLFLSSSLMFVVEPMVAKSVLPVLGGTPMVWNTCVLFFQIVLLGGYAYAHGVTRWLGTRRSSVMYLVVLALPLLMFPLALRPASTPPVDSNPMWWLLLLLLRSIGAPFFALAATASILQRCFAETDHPSAKDPYFLYAASNLGSLLALLMYPIAIEPALRLQLQSVAWSVAYGVFVILAALCVAAGWRRWGRSTPASVLAPDVALNATPIDWTRRLTWVTLAFIPSSLMLAVTTYFSTDIAPVPLFWIAPLSLYLLTFVAAFSSSSSGWRATADRFLPLFVLPLVMLMIANAGVPLWLAIPLHLAAFAAAGVVCHGRLADDRPAPVHLTEFYFWIAFGGMLGGVVNTLAAPVLFTRVVEYPLVLILACAARRGAQPATRAARLLNEALVPAAVGVLTAGLLMWVPSSPDHAQLYLAGLGVPAFLAFTQARTPRRFAASLATMFVAATVAASAEGQVVYRSRTFFGTYRVTLDDRGRYYAFYHGTTLHGLETTDPARRGEPLTYFTRSGPVGQVFAALPGVAARPHIAVVGLGVGSMTAFRSPDQRWTVYEIDPEVEHIARQSSYFDFLRTCGDRCRVVLGDARLSIATAPEHEFGVLFLDAFSSDAIPTHLLTSEAMSLYLSRIAPDGALVFHITNRHLALAPVVGRLALSHGLMVRWQREVITSSDPGHLSSEWMVMARDARDLGSLASDPRWKAPVVPRGTPLWTDDFSNILSVLNLQFH